MTLVTFQVDEIRGTITARNPKATAAEPEKNYTFDTVFAPNCKQLDVYNEVARPIVECVLEGYNGQFDHLTHFIRNYTLQLIRITSDVIVIQVVRKC